MRIDTLTIGTTGDQVQLSYPNSIVFMYSRQPIIIEALQRPAGFTSAEIIVKHTASGRSHKETRTAYEGKVEFDISRILQLLAPDVDGVLQRISHEAGQSLTEYFSVLIRYVDETTGNSGDLETIHITGMYGTLDAGEIYGAHSQRRLWVNFPQTFNLWVDELGESAFILENAYIYPDVAGGEACYECDLIGTLLSTGDLEEFKQMLPGRPQRNIGLTWNLRIERGEEIPEEMRVVTLVPDYSKRDEGTYLRWLNRRGEVSYYLFKNSQLRVTTAIEDTFSRWYSGDPGTPQNGTYNNPMKAQFREGREMIIGAVGVSLDEFEDLCDLATSPVVERLMPRVAEEDTEVGIVYDGGQAGTATKVVVDSEAGEEYEVDAGDAAAPDRLKADDYLWQRVNVVAGTFSRNIRRTTPSGQDFEIIIELPERNTIKL